MMTARDLVALLPGDGSLDVPTGLSVTHAPGWRAMFASAWRGTGLRQKSSRMALLKAAKQRQLWLETLMPQGTVLPALAGTRLNPRDIGALVRANAPPLAKLEATLVGQVQYQISVQCDAAEAVARGITFPGGPGPNSTDQAWQAAFAAHVTHRLQDLPEVQIHALPIKDNIAVNLAILLPCVGQHELDDALEQIDALWPEGLTIRQVGPSPGVSFASFGLRPISARALAAARQLLSLASDAGPDQLRSARHRALKQGDLPQQDIRNAAEVLERAGLLEAPGPYPFVFTWAEGQSLQASELEQAVVA